MVPATIDPETGQLATEWCPNRVREWFKPNELPQEECALHSESSRRVIAEDASGDATGARQNDIDRIFQSVKKSLGRIFGGRRH